MVATLARRRAAALAVLAALVAAVVAGIVVTTSTRSSAIDFPWGNVDDPDLLGTFGIDPYTGDYDLRTSTTFEVTGWSFPFEDVTVEVITYDPAIFCFTTADADGRWSCEVTGTKHEATGIEVYVDITGREAELGLEPGDSYLLCYQPSPSQPALYDPTWACQLDPAYDDLPDGAYTLIASPYVLSGEWFYQGRATQLELVVDTQPPGMASLVSPAAVGPEHKAAADPLPRVAVSGAEPWFIGTDGESGGTVHVLYLDGDDRDTQFWDYAIEACSATVDQDGNWGCSPADPVSPGATWTVGTYQEDAAGHVMP